MTDNTRQIEIKVISDEKFYSKDSRGRNIISPFVNHILAELSEVNGIKYNVNTIVKTIDFYEEINENNHQLLYYHYYPYEGIKDSDLKIRAVAYYKSVKNPWTQFDGSVVEHHLNMFKNLMTLSYDDLKDIFINILLSHDDMLIFIPKESLVFRDYNDTYRIHRKFLEQTFAKIRYNFGKRFEGKILITHIVDGKDYRNFYTTEMLPNTSMPHGTPLTFDGNETYSNLTMENYIIFACVGQISDPDKKVIDTHYTNIDFKFGEIMSEYVNLRNSYGNPLIKTPATPSIENPRYNEYERLEMENFTLDNSNKNNKQKGETKSPEKAQTGQTKEEGTTPDNTNYFIIGGLILVGIIAAAFLIYFIREY